MDGGLPSNGRSWSLNLHAHSTASDGEGTPEEIAALAEQGGVIIAISDHNTVDAHRTMNSPWILPAVEVTAEEAAVDALLIGPREELIAFFDDYIVPRLREDCPRYSPIDTRLLDVISNARDAGLTVGIPHYSHPDGIRMLDRSEQRRIGHVASFVELNGQLSTDTNRYAGHFAQKLRLPLVAADDSHCQEEYLRTNTSVTLPADAPPTPEGLMAAVREQSKDLRHRIRPATTGERRRALLQIIKAIGPKALLKNMGRKLRHL